jgi:hypothetical protein
LIVRLITRQVAANEAAEKLLADPTRAGSAYYRQFYRDIVHLGPNPDPDAVAKILTPPNLLNLLAVPRCGHCGKQPPQVVEISRHGTFFVNLCGECLLAALDLHESES